MKTYLIRPDLVYWLVENPVLSAGSESIGYVVNDETRC